MGKLRILHVSDLHLKSKLDYDQDIVLKSFMSAMKASDDGKFSPDLIVFSGDLLQAGQSPEMFTEAMETFVDPILARHGLGRERMVICPGNHDVNREVVRQDAYIQTGLTAHLRSRESINSFVDQHSRLDVGGESAIQPFARLHGFYRGVWKALSPADKVVNPFYSVNKFSAHDVNIGVCAFNTAWRCTGEADNVDRGILVLGERVVDLGLDELSDCDVKIAVFHHPTDWLTDDDRSAVEPRLHLGFDLLLFGHVHVASPQSRQTGLGGAVYSQAGCIYDGRRFFNGYSQIELDFDAYKATIDVREYSDRIRSFIPASAAIPPDGRVIFDITKSADRQGGNLSSVLARARSHIRRLGNDHVSLAAEESARVDLERHFICPPLQKSKHSREYLEADVEPDERPILGITEILSLPDNLLMVGRSEGGKTSIAHYAALKISQGEGDCLRLPLIGKFSDLKRGQNIAWRVVRSYANEISDASITSGMINSLPTLMIVDDIDLGDDDRLGILQDLRKALPNARWLMIATTPEGNGGVLRRQAGFFTDALTFDINELPRSSIRSLSANWVEADSEADSTDKMFLQVMDHIQRSGLPRSGYIVSLILWTLKNKSAGELLNESVLLQNIIDHLLDKMDYTGALRGEFDFTSKSAVLQDLSSFFKEGDDVKPKNEVIARVIEFLSQKGLKYDADEVVAGFIRCGILQKLDDEVSFRYKRFQEFFFAGYLRDNADALKQLIAGDGWLFYARELDIYTSRFRHESHLLDVAKEKLSFEVIGAPKASTAELHQYLAEGGTPEAATKRLQRMKKEPMSAKKIDEIKDRTDQSLSDRRRRMSAAAVAQPASNKGPRSFRHLLALELYSQFIRNLEFADRSDKGAHLDHALDMWTVTLRTIFDGFREVFGEIKQDVNGDESKDEEERKQFLSILDDFEAFAKSSVPTYIAAMAYHSLGSEKLVEFLDEIAGATDNELLKRMIAGFVLLEVDPIKGIARLRSTGWKKELQTRWVAQTVETRLFRYYLERHLNADVRKEFESLVADLEISLSGQPSRGKGRIMQRLARGTLKRSTAEKTADKGAS